MDGNNNDDGDDSDASGPENLANYTTNDCMGETANSFYPGDLEPYPEDMPPR